MRESARKRSIACSEPSNSGPAAGRHDPWRAIAGLFLSTLALIVGEAAQAQTEPPQRMTAAQQQVLRAKLNESTLIVAAGQAGASYLAMASDIVAALGKRDDVRLLAVTGSGGLDNLRDLLFLRSMDMAIVPANALAHAKATEALGAGLQQRVAYVTRLYSEEVHLLVGRNTQSIEDLRGKKVAVVLEDGTARFTANDLFKRLGVQIETVATNPADTADKVRSGELAAMLLLGGKPLPLVSSLPKDGSFRLLALPFSPTVEEGYSPAVFGAEDYPFLIPIGQVVETLAVSPVLLANAKGADGSAQRLARFVPALFGAMSELALFHRHPKWTEVNLAATLPGWSRLGAAEEWLTNAKEQQTGSLQKRFEEFLRATRQAGSPDLSPAQQRKLFEEYVDWTRKSVSDANKPAAR